MDSGATCHMCNDREQFAELRQLKESQEVTLGDEHTLEGTAIGAVKIEALLPDGSTRKCRLEKVLFVPKLSYNLLIVFRAAEAGNSTKFSKSGCEIFNKTGRITAFATKVGNLYYLEYVRKGQQLSVAEKESKERLWHRRYKHLGEQNLQKIARNKLVEQFDYDAKNDIGFCESCIGGKHHRSPFDSRKSQTTEILELVLSDVCGKMGGSLKEELSTSSRLSMTSPDTLGSTPENQRPGMSLLPGMESPGRKIQWTQTQNPSN